MYIYTPLCRYWITLYRYVLVFIVPHVDIELQDNKQFISNIPRINLCQTKISDTVYHMELSQGQIIHKPNKQELSSIFITHRLNVMHASVNFHKYCIFHTVRSYGPHTVHYMELSQGKIIQKPNKQVLSSFFTTHRLNTMHAPVKFHKYIPYG